MSRHALLAAACAAALSATLAVVASPAAAQDRPELEVTTTSDGADAAIGDGSCATASGQCTLRAALAEAGATGTPVDVTVPKGTYALTGGALTSTGDVTVSGADAATTTIDVGGGLRGVDITAGSLTLADITITGGIGDAEGGAAVRATEADLTLRSAVITANTSEGDGGAIIVSGGSLTIEESELSGNTGQNGGAVLAIDSTVIVAGTELTGNGATQSGGTLFVSQPRGLKITDSTFTDNTALRGGGVYLDGFGGSEGELSIGATTFETNLATGDGGAIYVASTSNGLRPVPLELTSSEFTDNLAGIGGAIAVASGVIVIEDTRFSGNRGMDGGGGAIAAAGELTVRSSSFETNESETSGGAIATTDVLTLEDARFEGNAAVTGEDDVYTEGPELVGEVTQGLVSGSGSTERSVVPIALAGIALVAAVVGLVFALRRRRARPS